MFLLHTLCLYLIISSANGILNISLLDTAVNPFEYLEKKNYLYENHTITTEDGYILLTVRIPFGANATATNTTRPPVLFVHGIINSFYDFLDAGPGHSIGFEVLAQGYDIWLTNTRGSTYGRKHVTLDPDVDKSYWNFSWHEVGIYDIPANIDYITNVTGYSKVTYVGHSQGTTAFLAMASTKPEYNQNISFSLLLAPVAYLAHAESPGILLFKDNLELWNLVTGVLQLDEILRHEQIYTDLAHSLCFAGAPTIFICNFLLDLFNGPTTQRNESMTSVVLTNQPAGVALKELTHFLQNANSGEFRLFDYGAEENENIYNQTTPPSYDISAITAPVALIYGTSDYFVGFLDAQRLAAELPNLVSNHVVAYVETNHLDILCGTVVQSEVNQFATNLINQYNDQ